ncbi:MAG: hypothetical protein LBG52_00205 [Candidatus Peribacteria bacterium]|nr:hypothetical protein [Candidatus Peribacteria bacterium]
MGERVEKRFVYVKTNYIDQNKPLVEKDKYESNTAVRALDNLLRQSRVALVVANDETYVDKQNVEGYSEFLKKKLEEENAEMFTKLENLYTSRPTELFLFYAQLPYYQQMLAEHPFEDEEQNKLFTNVHFFEQYMVYKTLGKLPTEFPLIDVDIEKIDYNVLHELLTGFTVSPKTMETSELDERGEFLDNKQFCLRYGVSLNIGQNILYEFAKSQLGYTYENDMKQLQQFYHESLKETNGIYYNEKEDTRYINENN